MLGVAVALVVACAMLWGIHSKPNFVLITVDTLRPDHLSCYGYDKIATPAIDQLASHGILFEQAYADVTWTTSSMASVMTGLYATKHGVQTSYQRLSSNAHTLAEYLQRAGFYTSAIVGSFPLDPIFGLSQGFDTYDATFTRPMVLDPDRPSPDEPVRSVPSRFSDDPTEMNAFLLDKSSHDAYRSDDQVTDAALAWLHTSRRREPFFLWVHYFGPHEKPQGQSDLKEEIARQLAEYDPDIVTVDREVGRLVEGLAARGDLSRTVIILHADHGQSLNDHQYFGHGRHVYDSTEHIPLIVRPAGGIPAPIRVNRMVRNVDIMPTILALAGITAESAADGRSLTAELSGARSEAPEGTYVETYLSANRLFAEVIDYRTDLKLGMRRLGFRTPRWKYIINDPIPFADVADPAPVSEEMHRRYYSEELYDLEQDPNELTNVLASHQDLAAQFRQRVWDEQRSRGNSVEKIPVGGETRERLKSLGYVD